MANHLRFRRSAALLLDRHGFDKMVENLSPENRKEVLKEAMLAGASAVQKSIRSIYRNQKPDSNLDKAIVLYIYPSGEGAVVRRFYVKGGQGRMYNPNSPQYRSYILNFLEQGASDRKTKGKKGRYAGKELNRGSIPALRFFRRGRTRGKRLALKEIEKILISKLTKQASK